MSEAYRILKDKDSQLKIDNDLVEIQKTIISMGKEILQELKEIRKILEKDVIVNNEKDPIQQHLKQMKIPIGYKGNNLKW